MTTKICTKCNIEKELVENNFSWRKDSGKWRNQCKECEKKYFTEHYKNNINLRKQHRIDNREKISDYNKYYSEKHKEEIKLKRSEYRQNNLDKINQKEKQYREEHKEELRLARQLRLEQPGAKEKQLEKQRQYVNDNREMVRTRKREYEKKRKQEDPVYNLRVNISIKINKILKRNNSSKNGASVLKYMCYTFEELKIYIESLFEWWMTWDNQGIYNPKTWDDNDYSTWTWQIDHITPQSDLPYDSMDHPNFQKCWSLSNLRPLSAKQNILDGVLKTRHKSI
jgi:hypothetical protein